MFGAGGGKGAAQPAVDVQDACMAKIRRADAGERFFGRSARQSRFAERKAMIEPAHDLAITKQAKALNISRGSVYYLRAAAHAGSATDLAIMRRLDRLHLEFPFAGSRYARPAGCGGVQDRPSSCEDTDEADGDRSALYAVRGRRSRSPAHKIYPYPLRGMEIVRSEKPGVAMDIT